MDRGAWWATVHGVTKESDMTWPLRNKQVFWEFFFPPAASQPVLKRRQTGYRCGTLGLWWASNQAAQGPVGCSARSVSCGSLDRSASWVTFVFLSSTLYSPLPVAERYPSRCERGTWPGCRGSSTPRYGWLGKGVGWVEGSAAAVAPRYMSSHVFCSLARWLLTALCMVTGWLLQLCMCVLEISCTAILKDLVWELENGFQISWPYLSQFEHCCAMKEEEVFLLNSISDVGCSIV